MTPLTLRQKQSLFAITLATFIARLYEAGYEVTFGETYRTPEQAALNAQKGTGIAKSLHTERLAADLMLFQDGRYLTATDDYAEAGSIWTSLHPLARWGGTFSKPDGNHFSFAHDGRA